MAQVKGKFIQLAGKLMTVYPEAQKKADALLKEITGKSIEELDPEEFYDTSIFNEFMEIYAYASPSGQNAIVTLGRNIYPTIKRTSNLLDNIKTPLEMILFEAKGFELNHRGLGVKPRVFIKQEDHHVVVKAKAPGYSQLLYKGVYLGILQMFGIVGKVEMIEDAPNFTYEITW